MYYFGFLHAFLKTFITNVNGVAASHRFQQLFRRKRFRCLSLAVEAPNWVHFSESPSFHGNGENHRNFLCAPQKLPAHFNFNFRHCVSLIICSFAGNKSKSDFVWPIVPEIYRCIARRTFARTNVVTNFSRIFSVFKITKIEWTARGRLIVLVDSVWLVSHSMESPSKLCKTNIFEQRLGFIPDWIVRWWGKSTSTISSWTNMHESRRF